MNYGDILKRAWDTIWKHKILWVFGLLASCTANFGGGSGGGGASNSHFNYSNGDMFQRNPFNFNFNHEFNNFPSWGRFFQNSEGGVIAVIVIGLVCLAIILSLVFLALGSAGQIGLSRGSWLVDEGEPKLTFAPLWQSIKKPFWRVFLMHFLLSLAKLLLAFLIAGGILLIGVFTLGIGLICLLPFICILGLAFIIANILISIMLQLMIPMMVNEDVSLQDAVTKSFNLLKSNFWPLVLMSIILFIINFVVSLILAIPAFIAIFGSLSFGVLSTNFASMNFSSILPIVIPLVCVFILISLFVSALMQSYVGSAWTITYRRITGWKSTGTLLSEEPQTIDESTDQAENIA